MDRHTRLSACLGLALTTSCADIKSAAGEKDTGVSDEQTAAAPDHETEVSGEGIPGNGENPGSSEDNILALFDFNTHLHESLKILNATGLQEIADYEIQLLYLHQLLNKSIEDSATKDDLKAISAENFSKFETFLDKLTVENPRSAISTTEKSEMETFRVGIATSVRSRSSEVSKGLRLFGSKKCGTYTEALRTCTEFDQLKECLRTEMAENCAGGRVDLIDCRNLAGLNPGQRFRCMSKVVLPEDHPLFAEKTGQWTEALCKDPTGSLNVNVNGEAGRFSPYPIGYYHCEMPPRNPPANTVACEVFNNDKLIHCGEVSSTVPGVREKILAAGKCNNSYIKGTPRTGTCPVTDLWFGCRKFSDGNNHEGLFQYKNHYLYNRNDPALAQREYYKNNLKCLNPRETLTINQAFSVMTLGQGIIGELPYVRPKGTGNWIAP